MAGLLRCALLALLLVPSLGSAQDFDAGSAAAQTGDFATALREWQPLADQGDSEAQYNLGVMYNNGQGVPQDYAEAVKWYRLAAEQGLKEAQGGLAYLYTSGQGVPQDYAEAVKWYRLAAEQGSARAQGSLGVMYYNGQGVPQDYVTAHMWLNLSTADGFTEASANRDKAAAKMTPTDISEAQRRAKVCMASNYQDCD